MLFLLFEAAEFMCVNTHHKKVANLRIILYKECNKCDMTSWVTCGRIVQVYKQIKLVKENCLSARASGINFVKDASTHLKH